MKKVPYQILFIDSWAHVPEGLRAVVDDIERRVIPAQGSGEKWNYIRVELWPDSGRFIAFPANTEEEARIDVTGCQLVCKEIEADVLALDPTKRGDEAFKHAIEKIYDRMVSLATPAFEKLSCDSFEIWDAEGIQR